MEAIPYTIRRRADRDLDACESLAEAVRAADGYPVFVGADGLRSFVESSGARATWVAERDGELVGHVALNRRTTRPAMRLASERLGVTADRLGVVARLMVAPAARRLGMGRALLDTAADEARALDLVPMLDVVAGTPAVALYERVGWIRLGETSFTLPDRSTVDEVVFAAADVTTGRA